MRPVTKSAALAFAALLGVVSAGRAADVQIRVDAAHPGHAGSPQLYGIFFEDINFGADGGLAAEKVKNGALEFPQALTGWRAVKEGQGDGELTVSNDAPWRTTSPGFLHLVARGGGAFGAANEGFRGMGVVKGERYRFTAQSRSVAGEKAQLSVRLVSKGETLAEAKLEVDGSAWREIEAELTPSVTRGDAELQILLTKKGEADFDMVSLCPQTTWQNRPHGLRADLVAKLADMKPAFLRFPGGCIVEGSQLKYRYQWKATLGDVADRRLLLNRWNDEFAHRPTPDYYQSFAVGFYEFFQLSEDIGAAPLPILNCGMACQFNSKEMVPVAELDPYIQDALDLIEFANGGTDTPWGARRAALGHPKPFGLTMIGVGNEQWGPQYFERYEPFARALKKKHPEILLVTGAGPFPIGKDFGDAWTKLRTLPTDIVDIVDEHSYAGPDWFLREATRFDDYPRDGRKIFMGEYAAQSIDICAPDNRNNLRCALGEAAFMTGLERNSDVVTMSSYAPLFGHEDAWQWRPNLIWFDSLRSYATPNYYVQQLFSKHRGDAVLPVEIEGAPSMTLAGGRVGVGTSKASVEFKDIRVAANDEKLWSPEKLTGADQLEIFRGGWKVVPGVLSQSAEETGRAMFGNFNWRDVTFSFKARKLSGAGGFVAFFRVTPGGSFLQWNVGGDGNSSFSLVSRIARHSTENNVVAESAGHLESNKWYDVSIQIDGARVRCSLDGKIVHDVEIEPLVLPQLYAVAGNKASTGEVILKVVNFGADAVAAKIRVEGSKYSGTAAVVELAGDPDAVNTLDDPNRITPQSREAVVAAGVIDCQLPANSLSIVTVPAH